jgi:hypothetical protein
MATVDILLDRAVMLAAALIRELGVVLILELAVARLAHMEAFDLAPEPMEELWEVQTTHRRAAQLTRVAGQITRHREDRLATDISINMPAFTQQIQWEFFSSSKLIFC